MEERVRFDVHHQYAPAASTAAAAGTAIMAVRFIGFTIPE
jgi:hypothetical protein